jgi:hypothetical protein
LFALEYDKMIYQLVLGDKLQISAFNVKKLKNSILKEETPQKDVTY